MIIIILFVIINKSIRINFSFKEIVILKNFCSSVFFYIYTNIYFFSKSNFFQQVFQTAFLWNFKFKQMIFFY